MKLDVLIFGPAAQAACASRVHVDVPDGATAGEVLRALAAQHPALAFAADAGRIAVNQSLAEPKTPVHPTDECALIALVGGG